MRQAFDRYLLPAGGFVLLICWLAAVTGLVSRDVVTTPLLGLLALPLAALVAIRPWWVTTAAPLMVPVSYSGLPASHSIAIGVTLVAFTSGFVRGDSERRKWSLLPVGIGCVVILREATDVGGNLDINGEASYLVWGLLICAAAVVAAPRVRWFLAYVGIAGSVFSLAAVTVGTFADPGNRGSGLLGVNANGVGAMAGAGVVAGLTLVLCGDRPAVKLLGTSVAAFNGVGLVASASQGALISTAIGCIIVAWNSRRMLLPLVTGSVVVVGIAVAAGFDPQSILGRDDADLSSSRQVRVELIQAGWDQFLSSPIGGVGRQNATFFLNGVEGAKNTHLVYLDLLVVGGILTLTLLVLFIVRALWKRGSPTNRRLLYPLLTCWFVLGFGYQWHAGPMVTIPAVALGVLMASPHHLVSTQRSQTANVGGPAIMSPSSEVRTSS